MNQILHIFFPLVFLLCVIYAIISDFAHLRIPNAVSITLTVAFLLYAATGGVANIWPHLFLAAVVFALFFLFFAMGWVGAADVKFLGALMLWAGPAEGTRMVILLAIFGSVLALALLALRYALLQKPWLADLPVLSIFSRWARNGIVPYGLPIALAALCVAPAIFARSFGAIWL